MIIKFLTISNEDGRYNVSALLTNKGYEWPSLFESSHPDNNLTEDKSLADSPSFLINEFYPKAKECVLNDDYSTFNDWWKSTYDKESDSNSFSPLSDKAIAEIYEIIEEAEKTGFFKNI